MTPGALLAMLKERPRPNRVVPFDSEATKGTLWENVRIVVPPASAHGEAQLAAHKRMRDELKLPINEWQTETVQALIGDITAKELLARVCFFEREIAPGKFARWFSDSVDVERALSADEIAVLFAKFEEVRLELGPRLMVLTDADVEAWLERLEYGHRLDPLARLQLPDWVALVSGLARLVAKERSRSATSLTPDSPHDNSPDTSGSTSGICATDTTSYGSPPSAPSLGLPIDDVIDSDFAAAIAERMSSGD